MTSTARFVVTVALVWAIFIVAGAVRLNRRAICADYCEDRERHHHRPPAHWPTTVFPQEYLHPMEDYANGMVTEYTYHIKVVGPAKGGRADIRP